MRLTSLLSTTLAFAISASAQRAPGYFTNFSSIPNNDTFSFGQHYAVLNLDLINGLVASVASTSEGKTWINNTATWINAVHAQNPPPLSFFSRIYSINALNPDIAGGFAQVFAGLKPGTIDENATMIYPAFSPSSNDVVVQKIRYYAGTANELELILASQKIDTVIIVRFPRSLFRNSINANIFVYQSGIRTSGVVLSTTYRLFDLNYNVYVIGDS
jgi:nicotinamidase-related amidase